MSISEATQSTSNQPTSKHTPSLTSTFCWFILTYFLLFLRWGYRFGSGDQVEILPYALKIDNPSWYSSDLFVSSIYSETFNQRWAVAKLLSLFGDYLPLATFVLFSLCLFLMVRGIVLIANYLQLSNYAAFTSIVILLLFTNGLSPGGNDLYSPFFTADSIAIPLCIFAFWFALRSKWGPAGLVLGLAALFQPLMGFQVFVLICLAALYHTKSGKSILKIAAMYGIAGGWMFLILAFSFFAGSEVAMSDYFDIYFKFRAPHHFIPAYFLTWKSIVFFLLTIGAIWKWYKSQALISYILVLIGFGALVYVVGVHFFDSQLIASTQWFKTMQWVKLFIVLGLLVYVDPVLRKIELKTSSKLVLAASSVSLIALVVLFQFPQWHPLHKQNDLVQEAQNNQLFTFVESAIPQNACFIIPIDNTDFKFGAKRSVYVDYKSIDPKPAYVKVWKSRIEDVYGSLSNETAGFDFYTPAATHYNSLSDQDLEHLTRKGVSYALFYKQKVSEKLELVYQDETNFLYRLNF